VCVVGAELFTGLYYFSEFYVSKYLNGFARGSSITA
jgi:hypothetical protein